MQRGIATFTLDFGRCPPWLWRRMVKLGRAMIEVLVAQFGPDEFIRRIADPVWFQALGTVFAFDWNASGLTTILTAALKEAIRDQERDLGIFICGGKGKTSRKTPEEICEWGGRLSLPESHVKNLVYNSRMAAKVDSALIQDGYNLYHHSFFFSRGGSWAVVQQGMNTDHGTARRYHWFSENITDLVCEPHTAISAQALSKNVLDMTASESGSARRTSTELVQSNFNTIIKDLILIDRHSSSLSQMARVKTPEGQLTLLKLEDAEFHSHPVEHENFSQSRYLQKILYLLCEKRPENYETLLSQKGVGPKTIRALALVSEIIYGAKPSYRDPARYSFAHGVKDATPYPIDRTTYDSTIRVMQEAVRRSKMQAREKDDAILRLQKPES